MLAVAVSCLGVVSRFVVHRGLWLDEALGVNIARLPVELDDVGVASRRDIHRSRMSLLHGWMAWFGTGDVAVRAFSGVIRLPRCRLPMWRVVASGAGGWRGSASRSLPRPAVCVAVRDRGPHVPAVSFLALAAWLAVDQRTEPSEPAPTRPRQRNRRRPALVHAHYWGGWLVLAGALPARVGGPTSRPGVPRPFGVLLAVGVGVVAFLPWLPVLIDQVRNTGTPWGRTRSPFSSWPSLWTAREDTRHRSRGAHVRR